MDTVETSGNHRPTPEEAQEVLTQSRKERVETCRRDIDLILEHYNCRLDASVLLRAGQVIPQVQIVANPEGN